MHGTGPSVASKRPRTTEQLCVPSARVPPPWVQVADNAPYFVTEAGEAWTPIGQNDAVSWPDLEGLFLRRNLPAVEAYLRHLADHGVTCLRLMLEYAQVRHRYLERPVGRFVPAMVTLWDDLFAMCERFGLRILLTPFDTFWMWRHWKWHPYNRRNGGMLDHPSRLLLCPRTRAAIKARFTWAIERWGGSGALFAWDLWNEIHPAQAQDSAEVFDAFIHDISTHVRTLERRLYGRSHPQTVSLFGPELIWRGRVHLDEPIFRHPDLDFATLHIYEAGTIDDPQDTVAPAVAMGKIVRQALTHIRDGRPFLDSEHGPIHAFNDRHLTLPKSFDDIYFRRMQWAHFASGGAGGGLRWPYRSPHCLTAGMRQAQKALADFSAEVSWSRFRRVNLNEEVIGPSSLIPFACGDDRAALIWLLRKQPEQQGPETVLVPGLRPGRYRCRALDTATAQQRELAPLDHDGAGPLPVSLPAFEEEAAFHLDRI